MQNIIDRTTQSVSLNPNGGNSNFTLPEMHLEAVTDNIAGYPIEGQRQDEQSGLTAEEEAEYSKLEADFFAK